MELVSIIIPTFHGTENLKRAVDSALAQTWKSIEVIVVDDNGPNDPFRAGTEDIMARYAKDERVKYLKHPSNKNGAAARNTGMAAAQGVYISFLDDDDCYTADRIEKCVLCLKEHPECDGVMSSVLQVKGGLCINVAVIQLEEDMKRALMLNKSLMGSGSNLFITQKAAKIVGGFDERFRRHQDTEYMIRFFRSFKIQVIPEILCVKFTDRVENNPSYVKMYETKMLFFEKFTDDIAMLREEDQKKFYIHHYEHLFTTAMDGTNAMHIRKAQACLSRYRKLTAKENLLVFMACCGNDSITLLSVIKHIKKALSLYGNKRKSRSIVSTLSQNVLDVL